MARANRAWKDRGLRAIAAALLERKAEILAANAKDVAAGKANGTSAAMLDRLTLTDARIQGLAAALENLANLPDPVGNVVRGQTLPNGLRLRQINVPMGVVAAIYEARPNVTVDIAGLAPQERQRRHPARRDRRRRHQRRPGHACSATPSSRWACPPTPCRPWTSTAAKAPTP